MKILVSEKLSPHKMKTPEGYLICTDAVLARTGKQTYKKSEIFADADDTEIEIDRKPEEVFSEKTLASFENKPITVEHPNEDVNSTNYKTYAVGFVRDVHKGTIDGQDVILGNLVITDAQTIEEIENGEHTDLSCGYDCDIVDEENPQQRNIRGNHVALCEQGRAGNARIIDSVFVDDSVKIWQIHQGYAIVLEKYWRQYGKNAYVDAVESSLDSARYTRSSFVRNDKMNFVIIDCNDNKYKVVDSMKDELIQSGSKEALKKNIATEIRAGKDPKQAAAIAYNIKRENDSEMNDVDYSRQTKQGYEVVEIYRDGGRLHAIVKRANDYVVALGYDTSDGTWAQGRYVSTYKSALETLKEEKPYARKIQDAESTYTEVTKALEKNEPEVKDASDKKVIWVKEKGKWLPWGMTSRDFDRETLRKMYHDYEDVMLLPDDGSKPKDSCETKDAVNNSTSIAKIAMQAMKIIKGKQKIK